MIIFTPIKRNSFTVAVKAREEEEEEAAREREVAFASAIAGNVEYLLPVFYLFIITGFLGMRMRMSKLVVSISCVRMKGNAISSFFSLLHFILSLSRSVSSLHSS